ncbi:Rha family transcriptional regulator [Trinickia dinghuensis]|nr:Rha family transcriptional regulator [Trinickia dinghuensis]
MKPLQSRTDELVRVRDGEAVTDSVAIHREFGRRHGNILASLDELISDGTLSQLDFKPAEYRDEQGKPRRMIELTERGALIAMPFIGGRKSKDGQVRLVSAFLLMREHLRALEKHKTAATEPKPELAVRDTRVADLHLNVAALDIAKARFNYDHDLYVEKMGTIFREQGISTAALPRPTTTLAGKASATHMLGMRGSSLSAKRFFELCKEAGIVVQAQRPSMKEGPDGRRSKVLRNFWRFTPVGEQYGFDEPVPRTGGIETHCVFYEDRFADVMRAIAPAYKRLLKSGYRPRWPVEDNPKHADAYMDAFERRRREQEERNAARRERDACEAVEFENAMR